jgi:hypothetical protein
MPRSTLRQRALQRRQTGTGAPSGQLQHLNFVADPAYTGPTTMGILKSTGRTVALVQPGNTEGMSPTWRVNDEYGQPSIVSLSDIVETGILCGPIPLAAEQLEQIFSNLQFRDELPAK